MQVNRIRNLIVHNEGDVPKEDNDDRKAAKDLADKWPDDISTDYNEIELHKTFVFRVLDIFDTFFDELFASLRDSSGKGDGVADKNQL